MKKSNAIAWRNHKNNEINQAPWLSRDYVNARRLEAYRQRQRAHESNLRHRGVDQPITEDFVPGGDGPLIRRAYIAVIAGALIALFMIRLAAYFIRQ